MNKKRNKIRNQCKQDGLYENIYPVKQKETMRTEKSLNSEECQECDEFKYWGSVGTAWDNDDIKANISAGNKCYQAIKRYILKNVNYIFRTQ